MKFPTIRQIAIFPVFALAAGLLPVLAAPPAYAAATAKPDVLVFSNGDILTGKLDHEADGKVFFKSDNAGTVEVPWSKLKSLQTSEPFAVIEKGVPVGRKKANLNVPIGDIEIHGDTLTVAAAQGAQQIPVATIAYLVDKPTFEKNVRSKQGLFQGVTGTVSAGASAVNSTQNSISINSAVVLVRGVPPVTWMPTRRRTLLDFNNNYGRVSQANTPTVETNIVHGGLEEDQYFSPRLYVLEKAMFDHNYSQGLDLQQLYGAGFGYTAIKDAKQQLDLTGIVNYTRQSFSGSPDAIPPVPPVTNNIIGSSFGDNYVRKFPKKIIFTEVASINPAWNALSEYSANFAAGATFPVFKNFGFSVGVVDTYLNDPPVGFQGNSFQFNTGLTYSIHR